MNRSSRVFFSIISIAAVVGLAVVALRYTGIIPGIWADKNEANVSQSATVTQSGGATEVVFGFDLRSSLEEDARQYVPFLKYLESATGYHFQIRFTPQGGSLYKDLGQGIVDLAAVGAVSYLRASHEYGAMPLARGLNADNKATYRSIIVIAPDSTINSVDDLKGKRFAFGSRSSTQGHIIPRGILLDNGIALESLAAFEYTGSHQDCANAVMTRKYDACGMQDTMARMLTAQGHVKILFESSDYPSSGIAATKDMSPDVLAAIRRALLAFDPKGAQAVELYNWNRTEMPNGFTSASDADYVVFRQQMIDMGLL